MRIKPAFLFILLILMFQTGCLYAVRYDGPYKGKVVDKETREPIEGAVVLGTWGVYHFSPGGGSNTFYDAKEAVTDKNGEFMIPGQGLRILSSVGPMRVLVYKARHDYYENNWTYIINHRYTEDEIRWEGDTPVFQLKKITDADREKDLNGSLIPSLPYMETSRKFLMTQEINKERIYRGYDPL